jgi:hypothetical protein
MCIRIEAFVFYMFLTWRDGICGMPLEVVQRVWRGCCPPPFLLTSLGAGEARQRYDDSIDDRVTLAAGDLMISVYRTFGFISSPNTLKVIYLP